MSNLRNIPAIDELLEMVPIQAQVHLFNREFLIANLRQAVAEIRQELRSNGEQCSKEELTARISAHLNELLSQSSRGTLQRVLNGTGVVLHTNLGRAPLGQRALNYLLDMARDYNNLEFDLESGERGSRYCHVEEILVKLTGAEAGLVVNNNAAAVLLGLHTIGQGREVIVSRGQLIEIGGAFRIPDVMKQSGAKLVEVGTTNRTYISDYADAINENTALLFSAHTSNYKVVGFSADVQLAELVNLGKNRDIPVMQDLGSGILTDLSAWGMQEEPTVQASVASGADLITFSGDKLLGGPQAGIIVGRGSYIRAMKQNQLTRALRVDKMTIAALEGTLLEYLCGDPIHNIPVLKMLTAKPVELAERAELLQKALQQAFPEDWMVSVQTVETEDMVGGGAYPTHRIPGYGVQLNSVDREAKPIALHLRRIDPALLVRVKDNAILISMRALPPAEDERIIDLLIRVYAQRAKNRPEAGNEPCKD